LRRLKLQSQTVITNHTENKNIYSTIAVATGVEWLNIGDDHGCQITIFLNGKYIIYEYRNEKNTRERLGK
jgi:hypothetical protein